MAQTVKHDSGVSVAEWESLEDPTGGRWEVLNGDLVVSPSPDAEHDDIARGLAAALEDALARAGLTWRVTVDVEWRSVSADVVRQAPRPDVAVGRPDDERSVYTRPPLLVVDVWSKRTKRSEIDDKRRYYRSRGVDAFWEVRQERTGGWVLRAFLLSIDTDVPIAEAMGPQTIEVEWPVPIRIGPLELAGWGQRALGEARQRAEAERQRAEAERHRAEAAEAERDELARRLAELEAAAGNDERGDPAG